MTRDELFELHDDLCTKATDIMRQKNVDYAGGTGDPFANFRAGEVLGIPAELGILLRCLDKFQRIRSFVATGQLQAKEESVQDAILDVMNYMVLLAGVIRDRTHPSSPDLPPAGPGRVLASVTPG